MAMYRYGHVWVWKNVSTSIYNMTVNMHGLMVGQYDRSTQRRPWLEDFMAMCIIAK